MTTHARLIEVIDRQLAAADCSPLLWYDLLVELAEAPERRLRMHELASRVVLSRSTITRLVARLAVAGLLARQRTSDDRRGTYALLAEPGLAALREAWPIYASAIQHCFAQLLSQEQARTLPACLQ